MVMHRLRAILVSQLLATCSLAVLTACDPCHGGWSQQPYELPAELPADATLRRAVATRGTATVTSWIVGDHGVLLRLREDEDTPTLLPGPVTTDLRGITVNDGELVVVGAGGTLQVGDLDGTSWTAIDLGTTADLFHVTTLDTGAGRSLIAVGDELMVTRDASGGDWRSVPAPGGGWGRLRGVGLDADGGLFAIGLAGALWTAPDLERPWTRVDLGITADLTAVSPPTAAAPLIGGSDGALLGRDSDGWRPIEHDFTGDVVDITANYILTTAGEVHSVDSHPVKIEKIATVSRRLHALLDDGAHGFVALGEPGKQVRITRACPSTPGR